MRGYEDGRQLQGLQQRGLVRQDHFDVGSLRTHLRITMNTRPDCEVTTSHGIEECAVCKRAAEWAVVQIAIIGTAVGRDRIMDPPGVYHKATARFTTNERA